jgi:hypothetical protein
MKTKSSKRVSGIPGVGPARRGERTRGTSKPALDPWQTTVLAYAQSNTKGANETAYIFLERVPMWKAVPTKLDLLADAMRSLCISVGTALDVLLAAGLQRTPESCDQVAAKIRAVL